MRCIIKQYVCFFILYVFIAALISSCKEILPKPIAKTTTIPPSKGKIDSLAALDSLPSFRNPVGLAVDASGNIYVADYGNNLIRKISTTGVVSTIAGDSTRSGSSDGTGTNASFNGPAGIAVDASGNLYITDSGNNLIRKINNSGLVSTIAGGDTLAMANGNGAAASFFQPLGISLDSEGNLYVADAGNNAIRLISPTGAVSTFSTNLDTTSLFNNPTGVAVDAENNVFVANYLNNNILKIDQSGKAHIYAGLGNPGNLNGSADTALFYLPNSIVLDGNGNIYVADGINNLIRKIYSNGQVSTFAGNGQAGNIDSTGTAASFNGPSGLAIDVLGNIYVADTNNNLIRKVTPGGLVTTIAGSGLAGNKNSYAIFKTGKAIFNKKPNSRLQLPLKYRKFKKLKISRIQDNKLK